MSALWRQFDSLSCVSLNIGACWWLAYKLASPHIKHRKLADKWSHWCGIRTEQGGFYSSPSLYRTEKIVYTYIDIKLLKSSLNSIVTNKRRHEVPSCTLLVELRVGAGGGGTWRDMFNVEVIGELIDSFFLKLAKKNSKVETIYTDWVRIDFLLFEKKDLVK